MSNISGDYRIDALLAGSAIRWHATTLEGAVALTYSFMSSPPIYANQSQDARSFSVMTNQQKVAVREILTTLSSHFNITFTEVQDSKTSYGQLRFGNNIQAATVGYAYYPDQSLGDNAGDIYINKLSAASQITNVERGTDAYATLIHEIGHALGLKHPGNYNAGSYFMEWSDNEGSVLTGVEDSELFSIMSYTPHNQELERINLGPYDYAALVYLYGAKPVNTGDDTYTLTDQDGRIVQTIYDNDGVDTLDASGINSAVVLNLNVAMPGTLSSVGLTTSGEPAVDNVSLGLNTIIENAIGGSGNDRLIGNSSDNRLVGNNGDDTLIGQLGTDIMIGGNGADIFGLANVGHYVFQDFVPGIDKVAFDTRLGIDDIQQLSRYITGINSIGNDITVHFQGDSASIIFTGVLLQPTALSISDIIFVTL